MNNKILYTALAIVVVGGLAYYFFFMKKDTATNNTPTGTNTTPTGTTPTGSTGGGTTSGGGTTTSPPVSTTWMQTVLCYSYTRQGYINASIQDHMLLIKMENNGLECFTPLADNTLGYKSVWFNAEGLPDRAITQEVLSARPQTSYTACDAIKQYYSQKTQYYQYINSLQSNDGGGGGSNYGTA